MKNVFYKVVISFLSQKDLILLIFVPPNYFFAVLLKFKTRSIKTSMSFQLQKIQDAFY